MALDRIGTAANSQLLMAQIQKAENALNDSNRQVSSGKASDTYTGYGDKTAILEAARSSAARADANASAAQQASTRLDLQDAQLSQLTSIADQVRQTLTKASADQDATSLMDQMQSLFSQAVQVLNSKDGNGFIYGGDNNQTPPVTVSNLSDLVPMGSIAQAFDNGSIKTDIRIGENQTVQVGMLASDLGSKLFQLFKDVAQFNASGAGPFNTATNAAQQTFLESTVHSSIDASTDLNSQAAANGIRYQTVQSSLQQLQASSTVYKGFVSNIEDVDMTSAVAKLQQNQVALQAAFQVTANLNQLSLLNFLH